LEVTNPIESACQQLGQLKRVDSESTRGMSVVSAIIQDRFHRDAMPQVWDELRRKIADVQTKLPPSVRGQSMVIDDFGDVYGIFLAITGEGYTQPELRRYAEFLRRELLLVPNIKKVEFFAEQREIVFLEMSRQRLAQLGINEEQIYSQLLAKNVAADGGRVRVGDQHVALDPRGDYSLDWGGEYEDARDARAALIRPLPYVLAVMVFIVVCLFNSIRTTLLIWLIMPLAIIGVTTGLLLTGTFGFMALLGVLSLGGELIKNQIVVLSKIVTEIDKGKARFQAILDGGVSKMRPVCMVVLTTVLGSIPLLKDPFFGAMAVCIIFGLSAAAVLSLIVTPVLYAIFFNVHEGIDTAWTAEPPPVAAVERVSSS
jgi:multidrug efflux pump subunit AcrB